MNSLQKEIVSLSGKTVTKFIVYWSDKTTQELIGTDIINAFICAEIPLDRMSDMINWEFKAVSSISECVDQLANVLEEQTFRVCLEQMDEVDFHQLNGKGPLVFHEHTNNSKCTLPTVAEQLDMWGWKDSYKAILITGFEIYDYHHKFLLGLLQLDVPIVIDIKDSSNLPKPVKNRQFKMVQSESKGE